MVINSSSEVTIISSQGQNYTGYEASAFGTPLLDWLQGVSSGQADLFASFSSSSLGAPSTETLGSTQFQVATYTATVPGGYAYDVKVGTPQGHQFALFLVVSFTVTQSAGSGYENISVSCASLYGQATCPPS